ncbi:MAG TPA: gamma-glutamyl-gamma-aminobutyrate hydrolase family protein [Steroidobacteraceae bacterium]|nr:gamma-glutamyl-gamma-aminobutyrate hydrolase family protein [Steroidobacteraceae bacterium]
MRKLLVLQHVPREPLGMLDPLLRRAGLRMRYVNFHRTPWARPDMQRYQGLVVLGGPMNVDAMDRHPHLATEIDMIRAALELDRPVLGICLGAQLLAAALGAEVRPNPVREIGWYPLELTSAAAHDPVLGRIAPGQPVFQWHAYTFDVPPGAEHLASTQSCPNQAFRFGRSAYGLQFHLEADDELIHRWIHGSATRLELMDVGGDERVRQIERETALHLPQARAAAEHAFMAFLQLFGFRRRRTLVSR